LLLANQFISGLRVRRKARTGRTTAAISPG
jgi:hypothetical protein